MLGFCFLKAKRDGINTMSVSLLLSAVLLNLVLTYNTYSTATVVFHIMIGSVGQKEFCSLAAALIIRAAIIYLLDRQSLSHLLRDYQVYEKAM